MLFFLSINDGIVSFSSSSSFINNFFKLIF
jgi:hypothetical protein